MKLFSKRYKKGSLEAYNNLSKAYLDSGKLGEAIIEKGFKNMKKYSSPKIIS